MKSLSARSAYPNRPGSASHWIYGLVALVVVCLFASNSLAQDSKRKKKKVEPRAVETEERHVTVSGAEVFCLLAGPIDGHPVLLMHGARFSSKTWLGTNTIQSLVEAGYRVIAIDIPAFGNSPRATVYAKTFATELLGKLTKKPALIITPSLSGRFAFPPAIEASPQIAGWVAIAPAAIDYHKDDLGKIKLPTLVVWGSNDEVFPVRDADRPSSAITGSKKVIFEGARHPCYLDHPDRFNKELLSFAATVFGPAKSAPEGK